MVGNAMAEEGILGKRFVASWLYIASLKLLFYLQKEADSPSNSNTSCLNLVTLNLVTLCPYQCSFLSSSIEVVSCCFFQDVLLLLTSQCSLQTGKFLMVSHLSNNQFQPCLGVIVFPRSAKNS